MKKTVSILMVLLLLWSLALPAAAAETAAAATLRLEKTEGTVKVTNASGKSVSVTDGMRLYSGYTISTEKSSYAYVSLDSSKAVKLDASSKAEVQKSGKKLELNAVSGSLFFNVTAPVDKDESLNIRTSTMVTGVRGTSGWVVVVDRFTSRVHLLEGTLTVTSSEPATGQMRQATITSGQTATATLKGLAQAGSQMALTVTNLQEKQVPGFVAVEVEKDPALQQKITGKSPLSVRAIIGGARERLKDEQKAADTEDQKIQDQMEEIAADETEQVFTPPVENNRDDDDDDDDPHVPPAEPVTPPTNITLDLDNPTAAELAAALDRTDVARVNVTNAGGDILGSSSYAVSDGQTLSIKSGILTVGTGQNLTVAPTGTLEIAGGSTADTTAAGAALQIDGTVTINGSATNDGSITVISPNSLHITGTLTNRGSIKVAGLKGGLLDIQAGGKLNNYNTLQIGDTVSFGQLNIQKDGTLNNTGSISIRKNSSVTNAGTFDNSGEISNSGEFFVDSSVDGAGTFTCTGTYTENRTDQVYAMAKSGSGAVYYLGSAAKMPEWYDNATVTLLGGDGSLPGGTVTASGVTLDLNGHTVTLDNALRIDGTLTLRDSAVNKGCLRTGDSVDVYALYNNGTFTMDGVLAECQVFNGGTMTLTGGSEISSDGGTTIHNHENSTLNVDPDTNISSTGGYGIYNAGNLTVDRSTVTGSETSGILNQDGTAGISGSTVTSNSGSGMDMSGGTVTLSDCQVTSGEVTDGSQVGISVLGGKLIMTGGKVSSPDGAGIQIDEDGTAEISGSTVTSQTDNGIYVYSGKLTMKDSEVSSLNGNGIEMVSGTAAISNCTVTGGSTGISVSGGKLEMTGGEASSDGGTGIYIEGGSAEISGAQITSQNIGIVSYGGTLTLCEKAVVSAAKGNAVNVGSTSINDVTVSGTVIIASGTVTSSGGDGVYVMNGGTLIMDGGTVTSTNGTGIFVANDNEKNSVSISGGFVNGGYYGIQNRSGDASSLTISGGTVTLTAEDPAMLKSFTVSGPFTFTGGILQGRNRGNIADSVPLPTITDPEAGSDYYSVDLSGKATTLDDPDMELLNQALSLYDDVTVVNATQHDDDTTSVTISNKKKLHLVSGVMVVTDSQSLTVEPGGELSIESAERPVFVVKGVVTVGGSLTNAATIRMVTAGEMNISKGGMLDNQGICEMAGNSTLTNGGTLNNRGTLTNDGTMVNNGTLTNEGSITNSGTFTNNKAFTNTVKGNFTNETDGSFSNTAGGTFTNDGSFTDKNTKGFINNGEIINSGTLTAETITSDGTFTNRGNISGLDSGISLTGGTLNMESGTIISSYGPAIRANGGSAVISGGEVMGADGGISNITNDEQKVVISGNAVITLTEEKPTANQYAVSGPFTYNGGAVRARTADAVCSAFPVSYVPAQNGEWFVLTRGVSNMADLTAVLKSSATIVTWLAADPDETVSGFDIPEGKTVIIAEKSILPVNGTISGPGTLINNGTLSLSDGGSLGSTLKFINDGTLDAEVMVTGSDGTLAYLGALADMEWVDEGTVQLMNPARTSTLNAAIPAGYTVTLDLNGQTIEPDGGTLSVRSGASLKILDSAAIEDGIADGTLTSSYDDKGTVLLADNAQLVLNSGNIANTSTTGYAILSQQSGAKIQLNGGRVTGNSAAVSICDGCSLTMNGGSLEGYGDTGCGIIVNGGEVAISSGSVSSLNNAAVSISAGTLQLGTDAAVSCYGGNGIVAKGSAAVTMLGGQVKSIDGVGISLQETSTLDMQSGAVTGTFGGISVGSTKPVTISDGTISASNGDTLVVNAGAELTVNDGTIGNSGSYAVIKAIGTVNLLGGKIDYTGTGYDAVVVDGSTAKLTVGDDCQITSSANGVKLTSGTMEMTGGMVSATSTAVYIYNGCSLTMDGGILKSTSGGCGIDIDSSGVKASVVVTSGKVSSENAMAISMSAGTLNLGTGATVSGFSSGIYAYGAADITMLGGTVEGAAGIYLKDTSKLDMQGGAVTGITGGISVAATAAATISDGTVTLTMDNPTTEYAVSGPFTFSGGTLKAKATNCFFEKEYFALLKDPIFDGEYYAIDNSMVSALLS